MRGELGVTMSPARNACDDVVNLATAPVAVGRTIISRDWQPDVHCIRTRWNYSDQYGLRARGGAVDRVCAHLRIPLWVYSCERVP